MNQIDLDIQREQKEGLIEQLRRKIEEMEQELAVAHKKIHFQKAGMEKVEDKAADILVSRKKVLEYLKNLKKQNEALIKQKNSSQEELNRAGEKLKERGEVHNNLEKELKTTRAELKA